MRSWLPLLLLAALSAALLRLGSAEVSQELVKVIQVSSAAASP